MSGPGRPNCVAQTTGLLGALLICSKPAPHRSGHRTADGVEFRDESRSPKSWCKCEQCRRARADYMQKHRRETGYYDVIGQRRATRIAAMRYRLRYPKAWAELLREQTAAARAEADDKAVAS